MRHIKTAFLIRWLFICCTCIYRSRQAVFLMMKNNAYITHHDLSEYDDFDIQIPEEYKEKAMELILFYVFVGELSEKFTADNDLEAYTDIKK